MKIIWEPPFQGLETWVQKKQGSKLKVWQEWGFKSDIARADLDIKWVVGGIKKEWWSKVTIVGAPQHEGSGKEEHRRSPENSSAKTSVEKHLKYVLWGYVFSEHAFGSRKWVEICLSEVWYQIGQLFVAETYKFIKLTLGKPPWTKTDVFYTLFKRPVTPTQPRFA